LSIISETQKNLIEILNFFKKLKLSEIVTFFLQERDSFLGENLSIPSVELKKIEGLIFLNEDLKKAPNLTSIVLEFINFLINNDFLSSEYANRIINYNSWEVFFDDEIKIALILYKSENYDKLISYYEKNYNNERVRRECYSVYKLSLTRIGKYFSRGNIIRNSNNIQELTTDLRFFWQNGELSKGVQLLSLNKSITIEPVEHLLFLNEKIRVLRDSGKFEDCIKVLEKLTVLEDKIVLNNEIINTARAKRLYNQGINSFLIGDFSKSIFYVNESLSLRNENYPKPYLLLRNCQSYIYTNDIERFKTTLNLVDSNPIDKWGKSLRINVEALYKLYILNDIESALENAFEAKKHEEETLSKTIYSNILILHLYIQLAEINKIKIYKKKIEHYENIDAQIAKAFGEIAIKMITEKSLNLSLVQVVINEYISYKSFLFTGLYSLRKLGDLLKINVVGNIDLEIFYTSDYSSSFIEYVNLNKIDNKISVFISYSWDNDNHKKWVFDLNYALREEKIDSNIDATLVANETINFNEMMIEGITDDIYDFVLVILTEDYKRRVESKKGSAYSEYKLMQLDILSGDYSKYILILRSGDKESAFPVIFKGVSHYNFKNKGIKFSKVEHSGEFEALVKRLKGLPRFNLPKI